MAPSVAKLLSLPMLNLKPTMFLSNIIEQTIKQRRESGQRRNDIIDLVTDEMKTDLWTDISPEEKELIITANALVLFFAGFDSTAIALSGIIHKLILHPQVQEKVIEEIDSVLEDEEDISPESLQKLKYTDQVSS